MYSVRRWCVRHARGVEAFYNGFERVLVWLEPVIRRIGYQRLERPVAWTEEKVKGFLFDCKMCGQCVLSHTGMSCPMNCPKEIRNGPCGGVRANGHCEVKPDMKCVWVEAASGASRMKYGDRIRIVDGAVDYTLKGSSSWLRIVRIRTDEQRAAQQQAGGQAG
ncbi:MAG: methylenetetrahydrofolate reductase C-terminal domain-containing protein [Halofilum sp. (in: g-proteobacteria)]|nr:methylenetetrahydrofolate reductase C-terminal domain-containing protein [Halofilum sp. (in: g-proteobacteria)]